MVPFTQCPTFSAASWRRDCQLQILPVPRSRHRSPKGGFSFIGNIRPSDDHLLITRIVADRVGAELDRQIFLERAAETAAMRERASIMRDLHDGLLQNLTAARAQLEMLPADGEYAKMQLDRTRELLRTEQRRVRELWIRHTQPIMKMLHSRHCAR